MAYLGVGITGILWNGFGCFDFTMTAMNNTAYLGRFPADVIDHIQSTPWWMFAVWAIGVFAGLAGSVLLVMRRTFAVQLFAASFLAALLSMIVSMGDPDAPQMEGMEAVPFIIIAIALALLVYAWWQARRGVLR